MNRGEIWLVSLDPTVGAEIKKIRPAVIVNDDNIGILPLKVIVPITEWNATYASLPWLSASIPTQRMACRSLRRQTRFKFVRCQTRALFGVSAASRRNTSK
jgi:mRNA-degrading endonuclease toxin of MazEF toxin-antitoxin module